MQLGITITQKQTTNLMMTTELRTAISLLQHSVFDLVDFIQEYAMTNPLIELDAADSKETLLKKSLTRSESTPSSGDSPLDYLNLERPTLHDYLLNQARLLSISKKEYKHLIHFIYAVNDNGYLTLSIEELCEELNITKEQGACTLRLLQDLEPAGVGAYTLQQCIQLQLQKLNNRSDLAETVISDYFELFSARKWRIIVKALKITMQDLEQVQNLVQTLNPRPGASYCSDVTNYAVPEVTVIKENGELFVALNDKLIPQITLNNDYKMLLKDKDADTYHYVKEKYSEFKWLHQSIAQRQTTLFQVANAIVNHQSAFFFKGLKALKPLTLKDIAEEIGVHESTISRITTNKYMETPQGIFQLKYFFSTSIESKNNKQVSSSYIKELIKVLVEREDKSKPLSDQALVLAIEEKIKIQPSRRVIAKYRNELRIPSSSKRRSFQEA